VIYRCDLTPQYKAYAGEIDSAIRKVLESGRYTLAREVEAFERAFAAYNGCASAVGVANGTDGLILSLKALGVGNGDEVITTPFTAIPTVSAIIASGARPVFTDINEETFLIDTEKIEENITEKTKAIMPVHIFGNVVDIEALRDALLGHIPIIEDAAQAHGSTIRGKKAGTMGDAGVFSFYPTKNLGGYGDGGAVVTDLSDLETKLRLLRMYGMTDKDHIVVNGLNSRLDELQATVLLLKLKYLDAMNQERHRIAKVYKKELGSYLKFQKIPDDVYSNYHVFVGRVKRGRDDLIRYLDRHDIQSNIYYLVPLHLQEANAHLGYSRGDFPVTEKLCQESIALPFYPELPSRDLEKIIDTIRRYFNEKGA